MDPDRGVLRGLVLAACLPALAIALTSPGLGTDLSEPASIAWLFALLYLPSLSVTGMLGVPIYFSLQVIGCLHWWSSATAGFVSGAIFIFLIGGSNWPDSAYEWLSIFAWAALGACAGLLVWGSWHMAQMQS